MEDQDSFASEEISETNPSASITIESIRVQDREDQKPSRPSEDRINFRHPIQLTDNASETASIFVRQNTHQRPSDVLGIGGGGNA